MSRNEDGTRVDLGDDLLEPTRTLQVPKKSKKADESVFDPKDLLDSAQIYLNEGFLNDSKKILHKLWAAPEAAVYRKKIQELLDVIHKKELDQILKVKKEKAPPKTPVTASAEEILRKLEADLKLEEKQSRLKIDVHSGDFTERDLIDLTIAFIEMGRMDEAKKMATAALTLNPLRVETQCLHGEICLSNGDYYAALESLQSALAQSDIAIDQKVHMMYLMGRLREETKSVAEATFWYQQTLNVDETYRDACERLKRLIR